MTPSQLQPALGFAVVAALSVVVSIGAFVVVGLTPFVVCGLVAGVWVVDGVVGGVSRGASASVTVGVIVGVVAAVVVTVVAAIVVVVAAAVAIVAAVVVDPPTALQSASFQLLSFPQNLPKKLIVLITKSTVDANLRAYAKKVYRKLAKADDHRS